MAPAPNDPHNGHAWEGEEPLMDEGQEKMATALISLVQRYVSTSLIDVVGRLSGIEEGIRGIRDHLATLNGQVAATRDKANALELGLSEHSNHCEVRTVMNTIEKTLAVMATEKAAREAAQAARDREKDQWFARMKTFLWPIAMLFIAGLVGYFLGHLGLVPAKH